MSAIEASLPSRGARRLGRVLSDLVILLLVFDAVAKLVPIVPPPGALPPLGYSDDVGLTRLLGALILGCAALYALPRTALVGAVLLTAVCGGAVVTHYALGSPLVTHQLFGAYLGAAAWTGLALRDARLRALFAGARAVPDEL